MSLRLAAAFERAENASIMKLNPKKTPALLAT